MIVTVTLNPALDLTYAVAALVPHGAFTGTVRAALGDRPDLVDPRRYLTPARVAMARTVTAALKVLAGAVPVK